MTQTVALLFGVHAHQPVGNFPEVIDDAHQRSYGPFIRTVFEFPKFHFAIHFSGWLLEYLLKKFPDDMALLRQMVERGQAELVGAGDTEPVLAIIPERDRIGQIERLSERLATAFGARPRGAWLTERVWEATVVSALADSAIDYVMVDDYHFLCTGKSPEELGGFFTTEENDRRIDLFPISEALRYRFPFAPAHEAVAYLESLARRGARHAAVYFDDIEKFGIWPHTYEWVFEKGWLKDFLRAIEDSELIESMHFSAFRASEKTRGVVYLPTTSYIEMNEWTLPVEAAHRYADLIEAQKAAATFEQNKSFLRGGIWKNFLSRYPESNWMHKRMTALSRRYDGLPSAQKKQAMRDALYRSQANDAYWHGLFGGLYLPHLRRAIYQAITELESRLDAIEPRPPTQLFDLDLDGHTELFLSNKNLQAVIRCDEHASIHELDSYLLTHNFGDTLARRAEHYHRRITHVATQESYSTQSGIASAHDVIAYRHAISESDLIMDDGLRTLFRDRCWLGDSASPESLTYRHLGNNAFRCVMNGSEIEKHYQLDNNALRIKYRFSGSPPQRFSTELNLAMPSCDGPAGRFVYQNEIPGGFAQPLAIDNLREISLEDEVLGGAVVVKSSRSSNLKTTPLHTVSQSEAGFEKIMQAVVLTLEWTAAQLTTPLEITLQIKKLAR